MAGYLCVSHCELNAADANGNTPLHLCLDINILQVRKWVYAVGVRIMCNSTAINSIVGRSGNTIVSEWSDSCYKSFRIPDMINTFINYTTGVNEMYQ